MASRGSKDELQVKKMSMECLGIEKYRQLRTAERGKEDASLTAKEFEIQISRNSSRIAIGSLMGHRVPRWVPEEPNKPCSMGLIRSLPFSRLRTIVWPRLNFQVQCLSVS
ncbi:hypothetical protein E3N88_42894 [Mikania micrantha]|uniref:Uncharacterized protein n=1 Tax=Mikania micrantha TaxID=192012 RepID=A0A5N6LGD2_9ASTR|nr:hypothetical protein E3N88_42894 [Mikania micrantha]